MYFTSQGTHTRQAHKGIPEGLVEEEHGRKGFFGPVSHLIRKKASTRWKVIDGPLKPRMFDLVKAEKGGKRQRLLYNQDVALHSQWIEPEVSKTPKAFRNADADVIYFCHIGSGVMLTEYGLLSFRPGDYLVMPKCIAHVFLAEEPSQFLVIENFGWDFREPDRGIVGRNAVYDTAQIDKPDLAALHAELKSRGLACR